MNNNNNKPSLDEQINFIRGARHIVASEKRVVLFDKDNNDMLMAIEENLLAVQKNIEHEPETELDYEPDMNGRSWQEELEMAHRAKNELR